MGEPGPCTKSLRRFQGPNSNMKTMLNTPK